MTAARAYAEAATELAANDRSDTWAPPQPIASKAVPEPYPLDALPTVILEAVTEVQRFVKSPIPMVASSALSILSVAAQGLVDVRRAEGLSGPTSLYLLGIADSGERKTSGDGHFKSALIKYERERLEAIRPDIERYEVSAAIWDAKCAALQEKIKAGTKLDKDTNEAEDRLSNIRMHKPFKPRAPIIIRNDDTPENLAWALVNEWPSSAIMSSEAGIFFGSHAMGERSIMRHLSLLNILWDGGEHKSGRRTSDSFKLHDVRLTVSLQIQEVTLREFIDSSGNLARGIGFFARFLLYWPASTQGQRFFEDPPADWPALTAFHQRVRQVLDCPLPLQVDGSLIPSPIDFSPEAKSAWVKFHDLIEVELRPFGKLEEIKDVAAKAADNAARLAALFHVFEHGVCGRISTQNIVSASQIVAWHLAESRRFFGAITLPAEMLAAATLETWLIQRCREHHTDAVSTRDIQQYGPGSLRSAISIEEAVGVLAELDRARLIQHGKRKTIKVNPALLKEDHHGRA